MAISVDKILEDLRRNDDYEIYRRILSYINAHEEDYSPTDYDILMDNAQEIGETKFNPKECSQIENVFIRMKSGYMSKEFVPLGRNQGISLCSTARELGIPLDEFLFDNYPDLSSFKVSIRHPTGYEREMLGKTFTTSEERAGRQAPEPEPAETGVNRVQVDVASMVRELREDMEELITAAEQERRRDTQKLRETINELQKRIEGANHSQTKEITRVLDASQYAYFRQHLHKIRIPHTAEKLARGEYQVRFIVTTPEDEKKVQDYIAEAESHQREAAAPKTHPSGYEDTVKALCRNFEQHTEFACGLNRTGSFSTLADMILEFAHSRGTEPDALPITPAEMNLFPSGQISMRKVREKRGIYPSEMATEAFNAYVRTLEGKSISARREAEQAAACDPEIIAGYIVEYDAIISLDEAVPPELQPKLSEATEELRKCDFYPNELDRARDEADAFYRNMGTSYDQQLDAQIDDFQRRYR